MDRYGSSARDYETDDDFNGSYPRRAGPRGLDERVYGPTRERTPFRGGRSGYDHRSGHYGDDDSDCDRYDGPSGHTCGHTGGVRGAGPRHPGPRFSTGPSGDDSMIVIRGGDSGPAGGRGGRRSEVRFTHDDGDDESDYDPSGPRRGHGSGTRGGALPPPRYRRRAAGGDSDDSDDGLYRRRRGAFCGGRPSGM